MWPPLLLVVLLCIPVLSAKDSLCPQVPLDCSCKVTNSLVIIKCTAVDILSLAKSVNNAKIDELYISNGSDVEIESLPFLGLRSFTITNSRLQSISPKAWRHIEGSIEHISVNQCRLNAVPIFGNMSSLLSVNLNRNEISTVPEKALTGLTALTQLRLEENRICEIPSKFLDSVKQTLVLLDLSGNCLNVVPAQILRNAANLMYLDLGTNNISEINNFELMNLPFLREFRIQNNTLRRIHPMAFMNVPQLQYMYIQDNIISSLDGNRLQAFKNLEVLNVSNNALHTLPSLKDLLNLKQVYFDGNLISKIDTLAFSNNPKLQLISVQNNNIEQVARNAFDSLDQLVVLLLGNNSLHRIERGTFDGIRNLQQLSVRNNSLATLDHSSFPQLLHLTTLDLGNNKISKIEERAFDKLSKLFWLDLSHNKLSGFASGVFTKKIANILLDGNPLSCDESFNDFLAYLVTNKVRTFLPFQQEIRCHSPEKYAGVRLKDLMMKKANETISDGTRLLGLSQQNTQSSLLSSFLPSLQPIASLNSGTGGIASLPLVNTITNTIPALRAIPGFGGISPTNGAAPVPNRKLNDAIEEFTGPLVRFATGGQPVASDIEQLIRSIPNMVVNVPGFGDVDLSKMDPSMIQYVLNGGQIPGIDKTTLEAIVKQTMRKMHTAASANLAGNPVHDQGKILPPLDKLPSDLVTHVMSGEPLPGLDKEQTKTIMEYYTHQMPGMDGVPARPIVTQDGGNTSNAMFNPAMFDLLKMLPPGYNLSKIPMEVIQSVTRGEVPDMRLLPEDLLDHFKQHTSSLTSMFAGATAKNISIEEILRKLPVFARPELSTFVPYDINELTSEMILEKEVIERHRNIRLITAIALAFVGALTVFVLIFFVSYTKQQRKTGKRMTHLASRSRDSRSAAVDTPSRSAEYNSPIRPPLMSIPKTPVNRTLDCTFGQPQLCSTLIDSSQARKNPDRTAGMS